LLHKAANQGHTEAGFTLGNVYAKGTNGEKHQYNAQANHCYRKAAIQGHLGAIYN